MIDPKTPLFNTIIFYILIVGIMLLTKPQFMYCDKTNKFKAFGCTEGKTVLCFPFIAISSGILLYLFFILIYVLDIFFTNKK